MEKNPCMFSSKTCIYFFDWTQKDKERYVNDQDIFILEVNKSFKCNVQIPEGADILRVSALLRVRYWSAGTVVSASGSLGEGHVNLGNSAQPTKSAVQVTSNVGLRANLPQLPSLPTSVHREHNSWPGNMSASRPALSYINLAFRARDKSCHADQRYRRKPSWFHIVGDWREGIRERQRELYIYIWHIAL